jgi:hypothetical protein
MVNRIFSPNSFRNKIIGRSARVIRGGSILLEKGGPGAGSSYPSVQDYEKETGQHVGMEGVNAKLKSLMHEPIKKKRNIRFSMS